MESITPTTNLAAFVCGYERGGTTLLSQILRQHPNLWSGFECGFLLADEIKKFVDMEPYATMIKPGWHISDADLAYICQADSWLDAYHRLQERSPLCKSGNGEKVFDKTPKYMENLSTVLKKVPDVPCIVIVRDPRAVLWSWAKRSGLDIQTWTKHHLQKSCDRYNSYGKGFLEAYKSDLKSRILLIQYEELCTRKIRVSHQLFEFLGLRFDQSFLEFNEDSKHFSNVYGHSVSSNYLASYRGNFPREICQEILGQTKDFKDWIWRQK